MKNTMLALMKESLIKVCNPTIRPIIGLSSIKHIPYKTQCNSNQNPFEDFLVAISSDCSRKSAIKCMTKYLVITRNVMKISL